jgi:hypothetical protein
MKRRRRTLRSALADVDISIGPNTKRLQTVRAGVRGVRAALDRGNCKDAAALLRLTMAEMKKLPSADFNTLYWLNEEHRRFNKSCRMKLSGRAHRRS